MREVAVQTEDFDAGAEIAALSAQRSDVGAVASFIGVVRAPDSAAAGKSVAAGGGMTLEHYPGMTEKALQTIVDEAKRRWALLGVRVVHRVGALAVGTQIVLVAVASGHRGEAFAACEFIMDYLKTRAPFWKCEQTAEGARWVDARDSDDQAAERWQA